MTLFCGVPIDDGISEFYKVLITNTATNKSLVGYMIGEASLELSSIWATPFEGDSLGNIQGLDKAAALTQTQTNLTTITQLASTLVFEGTEPLKISLQLGFVGYTNAKKEVDDALRLLCEFASPELNETLPIGTDGQLGRVPPSVVIDVGRKLKIQAKIVSVAYDLNAPKTKDGSFAYNKAQLEIQAEKTINSSQISGIMF